MDREQLFLLKFYALSQKATCPFEYLDRGFLPRAEKRKLTNGIVEIRGGVRRPVVSLKRSQRGFSFGK